MPTEAFKIKGRHIERTGNFGTYQGSTRWGKKLGGTNGLCKTFSREWHRGAPDLGMGKSRGRAYIETKKNQR